MYNTGVRMEPSAVLSFWASWPVPSSQTKPLAERSFDFMNAKVKIRFWSKVNKTDTCWLWMAALDGHGYGVFRTKSILFLAYRFLWQETIGPILEGLELDHLCRVRNCVNPKHLEIVTSKENVLRGVGITAVNARKKTCGIGHRLSGENLRMGKRKDGRVYRVCRICKSIGQINRREKSRF